MPLDPALDPLTASNPDARLAQRLAALEADPAPRSIAYGENLATVSTLGYAGGPSVQLLVPNAGTLVEVFASAEIRVPGGSGGVIVNLDRDGSASSAFYLPVMTVTSPNADFVTWLSAPGTENGVALVSTKGLLAPGGWLAFPETAGLHTYTLGSSINLSGSVRSLKLWARLAR